VSVTLGGTLRSIPPSFLGLSVEYDELPRYERAGRDFAHFLEDLRPPDGAAPVPLRIGGESADSTFWPNLTRVVARPYYQAHPYILTHGWMTKLGSLARSARLQVIFDLNLAAHSPQMAAELATSARHNLPAGSLGAFEIGDEPDLYRYSLVGLTKAERGGLNNWAFSFSPSDYDRLFRAYANAVQRAVPGAVFAGPSVQALTRSKSWWTGLTSSSSARRYLSLLTVHSYPLLSACAGKVPAPKAVDYLRDWTARGLAQTLTPALRAARAVNAGVRVTESGTAVCGGVKGQSDTFATALWAADALFNMVSTGAAGVNIHLRTQYPNTALAPTRGGIYAEPLFYGMALFARTLGPDARLLRINRGRESSALKVFAVEHRDREIDLLYINKSARRVDVTLSLPSGGRARVQRLTAPSIHANRSVTLAGQRLGSDGLWHGRQSIQSVASRRGFYRVTVPGHSAALLTVAPR
jgi:hypothetical protein